MDAIEKNIALSKLLASTKNKDPKTKRLILIRVLKLVIFNRKYFKDINDQWIEKIKNDNNIDDNELLV
jgi:hypothetical protein